MIRRYLSLEWIILDKQEAYIMKVLTLVLSSVAVAVSAVLLAFSIVSLVRSED